MKVINDLVTIYQLKDMHVETTKVRGNPAIKCTFQNAEELEFYFVSDPGDGYWEPNMMSIIKGKDDDANLLDYSDYGQDAYGSDPIGITKNGEVMIARALRGEDFASITDDSVRNHGFDPDNLGIDSVDPSDENEEVKLSDLFRESGDDPRWIVHDRDGHCFQADAIVLELVMQSETGSAFMRTHLPRV